MVNFLENIVNLDSKIDNPEGIKQVAEIIGDKLNALGFEVKYLDGNGLPTHVHAYRKGSSPNAKNLMIIGRHDTVFSKGTAKERPFTIINDKAYSPGATDMKSGITIVLFAIQSLLKIGWDKHNLTVFFCGDGEPGHPDTDVKDKLMEVAKEMDAAFNMETGVDNGDIRYDKSEDLDYIKDYLQKVADEVYVPKTKTKLIINERRIYLPMLALTIQNFN